MPLSAADARARLVQQLGAGIEIPAAHVNDFPFTGNPRASAVLILFGALDRVPASSASAAECAVAPDLDVLLTMRSNGLRNHAGQIAFPGGGVEPEDTDRAATALREANEETGLDPSGVEVLGRLPDLHIPVSNYVVTPVLGWWQRPSDVAADNSESVEVFRVPVAELVDPANRVTSVLRQGAHGFKGPAFQLGPRFGGHLVWGFTAMVLSGIFDSVGWARPWDESRTFEVRRTPGARS